MTHAHTWHTIASYPWARGMVYKDLCDGCGKVKKIRLTWPDLATPGLTEWVVIVIFLFALFASIYFAFVASVIGIGRLVFG